MNTNNMNDQNYWDYENKRRKKFTKRLSFLLILFLIIISSIKIYNDPSQKNSKWKQTVDVWLISNRLKEPDIPKTITDTVPIQLKLADATIFNIDISYNVSVPNTLDAWKKYGTTDKMKKSIEEAIRRSMQNEIMKYDLTTIKLHKYFNKYELLHSVMSFNEVIVIGNTVKSHVMYFNTVKVIKLSYDKKFYDAVMENQFMIEKEKCDNMISMFDRENKLKTKADSIRREYFIQSIKEQFDESKKRAMSDLNLLKEIMEDPRQFNQPPSTTEQ